MGKRKSETAARTLMVRRLKVVLPIGALAMVGLLFFMPSGDRNAAGLSLQEAADLAKVSTGLSVSNSRFSGETNNAEPFVVTATKAIPDGPNPDHIAMEEVVGELSRLDGTRIDLEADSGDFWPKKSEVALQGDVVVVRSDGYRMTGDQAWASFEDGSLEVNGNVVGNGPQGEVTSTKLVGKMLGKKDADGRNLDELYFTGGVRVLFVPKSARDQ